MPKEWLLFSKIYTEDFKDETDIGLWWKQLKKHDEIPQIKEDWESIHIKISGQRTFCIIIRHIIALEPTHHHTAFQRRCKYQTPIDFDALGAIDGGHVDKEAIRSCQWRKQNHTMTSPSQSTPSIGLCYRNYKFRIQKKRRSVCDFLLEFKWKQVQRWL